MHKHMKIELSLLPWTPAFQSKNVLENWGKNEEKSQK